MTRGAAAALLLWGCYNPGIPAGVPCNPEAPACPEGQACVPAAGGHVCGEPGSGGDDAPPGGDGGPDAPPGELDHIRTAPGWKARVFHEFSSRFTYVPIDFVDDNEMYSNQPDSLFVLRAPFAEALAVVAGRVVIELTASTYTAHDYGGHAPETPGLPDNLTSGTYVPDLDGAGPAVLVTSSSRHAGDGTFRVTPAWAISSDRTTNNTRGILWDAAGVFDELGLSEGYLGASNGVFRRDAAMGPAILAGDTKTMHLAGLDLLLTRHLATSVQLVQVTTGTHAERTLAERTMIELADGPAPAPHLAWATLDLAQLALVRSDGSLEMVAESTDAAFTWQAAAAAAPPHELAGPVYLIESNRALDLDRVIAIEPAP